MPLSRGSFGPHVFYVIGRLRRVCDTQDLGMAKPSGVSEQILSLPKGGGDVRGLGEKFTPDPHTGSGTYTVPIAAPEGRRGLTPSLTLSYSTGVGNGSFGLGWSAAPPAVRRKTKKGIPAYDDERDTFVVSGWE